MFTYRTLENIEMEKLHETFVEAFSDYQVKMNMPIAKLQNMLQRRGYVSEASIAAFEGDMLVGFILNGVREWDGKLTAYDTGTAVISDYRRQGITSTMFKQALEVLGKLKVEQYLLEVIKTNTSAVQLYTNQGFEITREFECFRMCRSQHSPKAAGKHEDLIKQMDKLEKETCTSHQPKVEYNFQHVDRINQEMWTVLQKFWDFNPSWQNSIWSIDAVPDSFAYTIAKYGTEIIGYGVIDKKTGDIPQIAVDKPHRGQGIGKSILSDLLNSTEGDKIGVLNVDSQCEALKGFLLHQGFEFNVSQYEMLFALK